MFFLVIQIIIPIIQKLLGTSLTAWSRGSLSKCRSVHEHTSGHTDYQWPLIFPLKSSEGDVLPPPAQMCLNLQPLSVPRHKNTASMCNNYKSGHICISILFAEVLNLNTRQMITHMLMLISFVLSALPQHLIAELQRGGGKQKLLNGYIYISVVPVSLSLCFTYVHKWHTLKFGTVGTNKTCDCDKHWLQGRFQTSFHMNLRVWPDWG